MCAARAERRRKARLFPVLLLFLSAALSACGAEADAPAENGAGNAGEALSQYGIAWEAPEDNDAAQGFRIRRSGGYALLQMSDGRDYLVVPEGADAPAEAEQEAIVLRRPIRNVYLAASSVAALWNRLEALSAVRFVSLKEADWRLPAISRAMRDGTLSYAGKYSAPDFETLLDEHCGLAVESTMILHAPKTMEKLEALGIPVLIDLSSYEEEPLGRLEWIRVYGLLADREEEARTFYIGEKERLSDLAELQTGKTVAFFYLNAGGQAVIRGPRDYIARMIERAGGRYAFHDLRGKDGDSGAPSVTISMEEFYKTAKDADVLIYNGTIDDGGVGSVGDLLERSPLFSDFRAVQRGEVWYTEGSLYQASDDAAQIILDLHALLTGGKAPTYFGKLPA